MRGLVRLSGSSIALAGAVLALLAAAPAASAKEGLDLAFHFTAANGYRVTVGGYDSTALISVVRPRRTPSSGVAWSTYIARGKVSPISVEADFGEVGSAAMRFHPSGRVTHSRRHRDCIGPDRYTIRFGVFSGSVRFRGEGGYTSADVHRVKGRQVIPRLLICRDVLREEQGQESRTGDPVTRLGASMRSGLTAIAFAAIAGHDRVGFFARSEQSIGSLAIVRTAFVRGAPATFASDDALSFASVTPPPPFSGTGSMQRGPEGAKSWTGSLAVSFPGAPNVPLSGPQFHPQLTRGW